MRIQCNQQQATPSPLPTDEEPAAETPRDITKQEDSDFIAVQAESGRRMRPFITERYGEAE